VAPSLAGVDGLCPVTRFALDLAAPAEDAIAALPHGDVLAHVAAAAAHELAPVQTYRGVAAATPFGAGDAQLGVAVAEARRRLKVHQVGGARRFVVGIHRLQLELVLAALAAHSASGGRVQQRVRTPVIGTSVVRAAVAAARRRVVEIGAARSAVAERRAVAAQAAGVADHHLGGAVEAVFELVADHPEGRQPHPARFHSAGATHAVALALATHLGRDSLQHKFTYI
jgi:hypothetical protein